MSLEEALAVNTAAITRLADIISKSQLATVTTHVDKVDDTKPTAASKKPPSADKPKAKAKATKPAPKPKPKPEVTEVVEPEVVEVVEVEQVQASPTDDVVAEVVATEVVEAEPTQDQGGAPQVDADRPWYNFVMHNLTLYQAHTGNPAIGVELAAEHGITNLAAATEAQLYPFGEALQAIVVAESLAEFGE